MKAQVQPQYTTATVSTDAVWLIFLVLSCPFPVSVPVKVQGTAYFIITQGREKAARSFESTYEINL